MRIRKQFRITLLLFGALLVIAAALTIATRQRAQEMRVQVRVANDIARGAGELVYLAEDYLIYRESRQLERWSVKFGVVSAQVIPPRAQP